MSENTNQDLSGVSETLLITLYIRAMESQHPDALLKDEKAVALVKKIGGEGEHYYLLGCSVTEDAWLEVVSAHGQRPFLFLAEGVFMYLEGTQVKSLVLRLRDRLPGAELVFDTYSPIHVWRHNLQTSTSKIHFPTHWGIWHGQELEGWGAGIRLLDEWGYLDSPDPRVDSIRWLHPIESLFRTIRTYHFWLGRVAEGKD